MNWKTALAVAFVVGVVNAVASEIVERVAIRYWGPKP